MISLVVLGLVCCLAASVIVFAYLERSRLSGEVFGVIHGIERRTAGEGEPLPSSIVKGADELDTLLDEAVQPDDHQVAVLAVNELFGRASLARSRALLLSRGLPRISLLSGGGGAFVVAALGSFSKSSLIFALGSVLLGFVGAATSHGLNASSRRLAKRYFGILDVLARQIEQHFTAASRQASPDERTTPDS